MRFTAKTRQWTDRTYRHVTTKFSCIDKLSISINSNVMLLTRERAPLLTM